MRISEFIACAALGKPFDYNMLLFLFGLRILVEAIGAVLNWKNKREIAYDIANVMTQKVVSQDKSFFQNTNSGKITAAFSGVVSSLQAVYQLAMMCVIWLTVIPTCVYSAFTVHYSCGLMFLGFLALWFVAFAGFASVQKSVYKAHTLSIAQCAGSLSDVIHNIAYVKDYGTENYEKHKFQDTSSIYKGAQSDLDQFNGFVGVFYTVMWALNVAGCCYLASQLRGMIAPEKLVQIVPVSVQFATAMSTLQGQIMYVIGMVIQIGTNFACLGDDAAKEDDHTDGNDIEGGDIELDNVSLKIDDKKILKNISLKIKDGARVGLVGRSGAGKSTLLGVLTGGFPGHKGKVRIGNIDTKTVKKHSLKQSFAHLHQKVSLFENRSIGENIAYGSGWATRDDVKEAARKACIADVIESLPDKYDTQVKGVVLSGGQQQRLLIARAILRLKHAEIFLADEGTSALDPETEKLVGIAFKAAMRGKTAIIIAHRIETLSRLVDYLIVVENGEIAEVGKHEELLAKEDGAYKRMWAAQSLTL